MSETNKMKDIIEKAIAEADLVLVGIGEEFGCKEADIQAVSKYAPLVEEISKKKEQLGWLSSFIRKDFLDNNKDEKVQEAYKALHALLQDKNYFIVTENTDGRIFDSPLKEDRMVAPCGNFTYLQCEKNCSHELIPAKEITEEVLQACQDVENFPEKMGFPVCARCGEKLVFNTAKAASYEESSYLPMWERYMKWLQGTLNKKVCILELGVGFSYPTIIRWPFEKIGFLNQKADFIRVHHSLYQLSEELKEKGVSVAENSVDFLRNTFVY